MLRPVVGMQPAALAKLQASKRKGTETVPNASDIVLISI